MEDYVRRVRLFALALGLVVGGLPAYASTSNYVNYQAVAGDFNGDGWTDVILQPLPGAQGAAELIAYPDGNFGSPLATWPNESGGTNWNADAHRLVVGDFNGDGRDDVLLQGAAGLGSRIAFARPDGDISQTDVALPDTLGGLDPSQASRHLVVGDFNGDGRDDLLLQANTFVGTDGVALVGSDGTFTDLASKWSDGFHGLSWPQDREAITAGDFAAAGSDELLMRSASATGTNACCELIGFDKAMKPTHIVQQWAANFLGVDWQPSTHLAIVGDFNGDAHADILLQPRAPGGEVDLILTDSDGLVSSVADRWSSERDGVDWSSESYLLVPENAAPGQGATLMMVPKQTGLPYRRAQFNTAGQLQSVSAVTPPAAGIFAPAGGSAAPAAGGGGLKLHVLAADSPQPQGTPGTTDGQASVSSGVAGYSIKIAVPPGRMGMQPSLSLSYSSNGGDGHEGVGWSLGGLSAIYRCPATKASDGYTAGTTFSYQDHFCLDGQKLMLASGSYGSNNSTYHTEVNGFSTITAYGPMGQGPSSFKVRTADGRTLYYGYTTDSRLRDNSSSDSTSVFTWALSYEKDPNGNEIDYHYHNHAGSGEYYPSEIDYTLGGGAGPTRKVVFHWQARSAAGASPIIHYLAGMKQSTTQLLTGITTQVGSSVVRNYTLNYTLSPATQRPLVSWVQTCADDSNGQTCFSPTNFSYQAQQAMVFAPVSGTSLNLIDTGGGGNCKRSPYGQWDSPKDINGDGRLDLFSVIKGLGTSVPTRSIQFGQPGGFSAPQSTTAPSAYRFVSDGKAIDFNLDGRTDSLLVSPAETHSMPVKISYATPVGTSAAVTYQTVDTGVDLPPTPSGSNGGVGYPKFPNPIVADVNGDGRADLVVASHTSSSAPYQLQVYLATNATTELGGAGMDAPSYAGQPIQTFPQLESAQPLDYDADGRTDLLVQYYNADHYALLHSNGTNFTAIPTNIPTVVYNSELNGPVPPVILDVNGDSLPDIAEPEKVSGQWHWAIYVNTGAADGTFAGPIDTGLVVATASGVPLAVQAKAVRDPDGREDLLVPTARTFEQPELQPLCRNQSDGAYCGTYWPDYNSLCINTRSDPTPQAKDGYDWHLYRSEPNPGNDNQPTFSDMGLIAQNLADVHVFDVNSDGLSDILGVRLRYPQSGSSFQPKNLVEEQEMRFSSSQTDNPAPDLMVGATNGLSVTDTFSYEALTGTNPTLYSRGDEVNDYPDMLFQSPMQVVASMSETNPAGSDNTQSYSYTAARYNVWGRGFAGFQKVTETDEAPTSPATNTTTTTIYRQDFPFIGRVASTKTTVTGGATISTSSSTWAPASSYSYPDADNTVRYVVYPTQSSQTQYDPGAGVQISHSTTIQSGADACGKPTGDVVQTTTQQATQSVDTTTYYNGGDADQCWLDTVHQQVVSSSISYPAVSANSTPATSDTLDATTTYSYDPSKYWEVTGKKVVSTHNGTVERLSAYGYDGFGNRTSVTEEDPSGELQNRTTTSDYGTDGYFPLKVTNALGQTVHFTYDAATGNKTSAIDPNGIETDYAFDAFGRKHGGKNPGASAVSIDYELANASGISCPLSIARDSAYALKQTQDGYPITYTCYDAYGNVLRTMTQAFDGGWIHQDYEYDALGRKLWSTQPRYGNVSIYRTYYKSYDVLGRAHTVDSVCIGGSAGADCRRQVQETYSGLTVAYKDTDETTGIEHDYTRYYDGIGKGNGHLVQVEQQTDNGTYTATYRYDAGGNLIRATDPAGNAITATYDGFGDKLTLDDPDKGKWGYTYDGFGEQASETNAASQTISTTYDKLGRATKVSDPADNRITKTTFDPMPDGIGQPGAETVTVNGTVTYARQYGYDTAGRASLTEITTGGATYLQGMHYDNDGRPDQQAYPALSGSSNQPPSVSASANPSGAVAPDTPVTLTAKGSDPNGSWQLSYHWAQDSTDAIQVPISQADTDQASVTLSPSTTTTAYHFTVTASDGLSTATDTVTLTAEPAPTGTLTPKVTPSTSETGTFTVSWGTVSHATRYQLQQSENGGSWVSVYDGGGASTTLSGRGAATYQYQVRGYNAVGHAGWGATATETVVAPPPPQAPLLSPNPSPNGAYTVQWGSMTNADSYDIDEKVNSGSWTLLQNVGTPCGANNAYLCWSTSGVANNSTMTYEVRSCNAVTGCGNWSAKAYERVIYVPATPTSFHHVTPPILVPPGNAYNLAWDGMQYATSYDLALNGTTATQTGITGTSQTETAPNRYDATDAWRIRACSAGGCSAWSAAIQVSTQPSGGGGCTLACKTPAVLSAPKAAGGSGSPSSQLVVDTAYTSTGYPETLTRASDGSVYAQVAAMNAFGQATEVFEGGTSQGTAAVTLTRGYDPATGLVTSIEATNAANTPLATVTSSWDGFANLSSRSMATSDMSGTSIETPTYDKLNRLTGSTTTLSGGGTTSESYGYDKTGNRTEWDSTDTQGHLTTRHYTYGFGGGTLPHAVKTINGTSGEYVYNKNGEMTTDAGRTLGWTAFGKASSITQGSTTVTFVYGPGDSRYQKQVIGSSPETVTYLGGAERLDINGNLSIRRTLSLAGVTIIDTGGAQSERLYPVADHLGSTIAVVNSTGTLMEGLSYADFGQRYTSGWVSPLPTSEAVIIDQTQTDKGYTGQESLDSVGLDDYNARLYDPGLGRFLSVDPMIGHPGSTQSINPYSYVENNPLNRTDPTGETGTTACTKGSDGSLCGAGSLDGKQGESSKKQHNHGSAPDVDSTHVNHIATNAIFNVNAPSQSATQSPTLAPPASGSPTAGGDFSGVPSSLERSFMQSPIYTLGKDLAAMAAYFKGLATDDQALQDYANNILNQNMSKNISAVTILATTGKGEEGAPIGENLTNVRVIPSGRLKGYSRGNTELPNGMRGAKKIFKQLTGRSPRIKLGEKPDIVILKDGREISFRAISNSGTPKVEIVNHNTKFLEKISFPDKGG